MIDPITRIKIEKTLGDQEHKERYFRECYRKTCDGKNFIVVTPLDETKEITMVFDEETGEFAGLEQWSYIKENGELL